MEAQSESSRIFVKNLPPSLKDADFQKHFAKAGPVTDARLLAHRRIGYVGYKTPEAARHAIKHFNCTFIKMSKIHVEIAQAVGAVGAQRGEGGSTARYREHSEGADRKRKRSDGYEESRGEKPEAKTMEKPEARTRKQPNPKLNEFLEVMQSGARSKVWSNEDHAVLAPAKAQMQPTPALPPEGASDGEYEAVPKKQKTRNAGEGQRNLSVEGAPPILGNFSRQPREPSPDADVVDGTGRSQGAQALLALEGLKDADAGPPRSDADWLRSRTSRLLGLEDEDGSDKEASDDDGTARDGQHVKGRTAAARDSIDEQGGGSQPAEKAASDASSQTDVDLHEPISPKPVQEQPLPEQSSGRLFVRNLSYDTTEQDLWDYFTQFGSLEEVHVPRDGRRASSKGFAYVQFQEADPAEHALAEADGKTFQGRLLHVLPASPKRDGALDEYALSKLPHKKQLLLRKKAGAASASFQWNTLFMNPDAVLASTAEKLGVSKSEVLDPTSASAAVKQAHAEANVLQDTKNFFESNGVQVDSFRRKGFSDTTILVKNFSFGTSTDELRRLFEACGTVKRLLMPPAGTMAIVEFEQPAEAKKAFSALAYRKLGDTILFLEKAPKDIFQGKRATKQGDGEAQADGTLLTTDLLDPAQDEVPSTTLFVRNLSFDSTTAELHDLFLPLKGFLSARVKTRTDRRKPGQVLSMGFGFVEFRSKEDAQAALKALDGYALDGHKLQIRASHRAVDAAEERRRDDNAKKTAGRHTKIIIKNLPFEATKRDVRELFSPYGKLRSVRVPKKFDSSTRGFAFGDFVTSKEAQNAMDALAGAHLLGRRLNLEFAAADSINPEEEIEKMSKKVSKQADKVAAQELARSSQRKKFNVHQDEDNVDA